MAAKEMYGNLGQSRDFSLLAGTGTERTVGVAVKPGSGLLARGTIIQMGADGLYVPAETGKMADGACAVLESDTQTGSEVKGVAPSALAYSHGFLLKGKLSLESLLDNLHMQQTQETNTETKTKCLRCLRLIL